MNKIRLLLAKPEDEQLIHTMKYNAFLPLYNRYHDDELSPVKEPIDKVIAQLKSDNTDYYIIFLGSEPVGAIRIVNDGMENDEQIYRIAPVFILPEYQNFGIGYKVLNEIFNKYKGAADIWHLSTIKEEERNCHLYEKCGFKRVGDEKKVNDKMTIVYYTKWKE